MTLNKVNFKKKYRMMANLLGIAEYTMKSVELVDEDNYFDILKSMERKIRKLKYPYDPR
jgi:hypothetical protein|tara:strand:- start:16601 stop:16777 length:177 start_codon:yes stop_codon:yes gene_type:complete